jgi:hypothetical protein
VYLDAKFFSEYDRFVSKIRHKVKMDKSRTNITLHGDDLELLNKVKSIVEREIGQKVSQAFVIRRALNKLVEVK